MTAIFVGNGSNKPFKQNATPTEGSTVAVSDVSQDVDLWLTPGAPLAALTIQLPAGYDGMNVNIGSSKAIGILSITGATNIYDALNTLSPGNSFTLHRFAVNNWSHP